jgi:hypothetical protein
MPCLSPHWNVNSMLIPFFGEGQGKLGFELRAWRLQTDALPLEPCLQSILLWLYLEMGVSKNSYLSGLASNHYPSDLSLPSS